jgi:quinolinate synthase
VILKIADFVGSTSALLNYTIQSPAKTFIVATESGILHEMTEKNPGKVFIPAPPNDSTCACNECQFMKLNTMEKLYRCLKDETPEIFLDEEVIRKAAKPIKRMLELSEVSHSPAPKPC